MRVYTEMLVWGENRGPWYESGEWGRHNVRQWGYWGELQGVPETEEASSVAYSEFVGNGGLQGAPGYAMSYADTGWEEHDPLI